MLVRPYHDGLQLVRPQENPESITYAKETLFSYLEIYRVADKYDMPRLINDVNTHFKLYLNAYFIRISKEESSDGHAAGFLDIVLKVYEVTNGDKECPIMQTLLEYGGQVLGTAKKTRSMKDSKINEGYMCRLYLHAMKSYAELGRDICVMGLEKNLLLQS